MELSSGFRRGGRALWGPVLHTCNLTWSSDSCSRLEGVQDRVAGKHGWVKNLEAGAFLTVSDASNEGHHGQLPQVHSAYPRHWKVMFFPPLSFRSAAGAFLGAGLWGLPFTTQMFLWTFATRLLSVGSCWPWDTQNQPARQLGCMMDAHGGNTEIPTTSQMNRALWASVEPSSWVHHGCPSAGGRR